MPLKSNQPLCADLRSAVEYELKNAVIKNLSGYPQEYLDMLLYQLGLDECGGAEKGRGKRIRPLLVLQACQAAGGDWQQALPAAAAVEMVHNFSLIHDDIQDRSDTRRGRPTIWKKWGEAQAINAGDAMLNLAVFSMLTNTSGVEEKKLLKAVEMLQLACLKLTRGQHLDIAFENKDDLPIEFYWQMVEGKTGALLGTSLGLGVLIAGVSDDDIRALVEIGIKIGNAFQVQDDWLGIWGDVQKTGKSTLSDLTSKKKTYPVLLGLKNRATFFENWISGGEITSERGRILADLLQKEGIEEKTRLTYGSLYSEAIQELLALKFDVQSTTPLIQELQALFDRTK